MAGDEERLVVLVEARVRDLERNMQKAERAGTKTFNRLKKDSSSATRAMEQDMIRSTGRINQALATTSSRIGSFGSTFAKGLGAGIIAAAFAGITSNISATIRGIAEMGDQARRAGMDAKSFQEWKFVAEQNRIGVDSLVDGFKELSLRADEFISTGAGSGAEAFKRLGFTASDLATKLQDPSRLMLEIIGRMEDLDKAAQIRVADEIFGGTGGERFVELLSQGEDGLRRTVARAHELGAVMSDEAIAKAAELDRKFSEVAATLGSMWKTGVVGAAEFVASMAEVEDAASRLGGAAAPGESAEDVEALGSALSDVRDEAQGAAHSLQMAAQEMEFLGNGDAAAAMAALGREMTELIAQYDAGQISAETFTDSVESIGNQAEAVAGELKRVDAVAFGGVIGRLGGLGEALRGAIGLARSLTAALPGNQPAAEPEVIDTEDPRSHHPYGSPSAPATSPRPQAPGFDALGDWEARRDAALKAQTAAAGGGGKGKPKVDDYAAQAAAIRDQTAALEAEAVALLAVASGGQDYGDAVEYARTRAELLHAAQKAGREITPQLVAEIDKLAASYVTAGESADKAAERLDQIKANGERGAEAITGIFTSLLSGASSAKEALAGLLIEMAKIQFQKAMLGLAEGAGGGFFAGLGKLLSFDTGGYTGAGGRREPAGVVHRGEVVWSQDDVRRAGGVATVEAMRRGLGGYEGGGAVGGGSMSGPAPARDINVHVTASFDETGNLYVRQVARDEAGRATKAERKALPDLLREYNRNPHRRF